MALLPVADALERLLTGTQAIDDMEMVGLHQARGRVLARSLSAKLTQPPFDSSAMDGYAVLGADVGVIGAILKVIGQSAAGHGFEGKVTKGQAVRIFTGAPVPDGADTVLLQEDAEKLDDGTIRTLFAPATGRHIRPRGQDFVEGEVILAPGDVLDAGRLVVAAAMNHSQLPVFRKPRVAVIATGDELMPPGSLLEPNRIIASNTYGVASLAADAGADIIDLGIVDDRPELITAAIERAVEEKADIIVTLGGASVGDHDLVQSTMLAAGMKLDFWKIAMRPGKPLMVGDLGRIKVLGLPGNPVSSMVCALLFLEPLVAKMAQKPARDRMDEAVAATDLAPNDHRQDYLRASLCLNEDGKLAAKPYGKQDSSMMKIFAKSDCLIVRRSQSPAIAAGESCEILVLRSPQG